MSRFDLDGLGSFALVWMLTRSAKGSNDDLEAVQWGVHASLVDLVPPRPNAANLRDLQREYETVMSYLAEISGLPPGDRDRVAGELRATLRQYRSGI
ncbi:MAG: hypothetical protein Q7W30_05745 [Coriobacteriia bacterium]|nr:hypothetical protein [Coriobacteriia bacterium]